MLSFDVIKKMCPEYRDNIKRLQLYLFLIGAQTLQLLSKKAFLFIPKNIRKCNHADYFVCSIEILPSPRWSGVNTRETRDMKANSICRAFLVAWTTTEEGLLRIDTEKIAAIILK